MADEQTPAAQVPAVSAVLHDPLPESNWLWRRVFSFAIITASCFGIFLMAQSMRALAPHNPDLAVKAMLKIIGWVLMLDWCVVTYYLIAPTGEQVTRWVQTAGMLKQGVSMLSTAAATSPAATASSTTAAGQSADPPAPPAPQPDVDAAPTER